MSKTIADIFKEYRVETAPLNHRHVRSGWVGVDCPSCSPGSQKFRLGFNLTTGGVSCWVCGKVTNPVRTLATLCRVSEADAARLWGGRGKYLPTSKPLHTGTLKVPGGVGPLLPAHAKYLRNRGFDVEQLTETWGVQGIGMAAKLQWRIYIPIHDFNGTVVSWTTRSIANDPEVRYISAAPEEEAVPHKEVLFGSHLANHAIVISEGPLDAIAIGPGGVATFGVDYSEAQFAWMTRFPIRAVCYDSSPDAQRRAEKLCRALSMFPGWTENILLETGKDPAECDESERIDIRQRYLNDT